MFQFISLLNEDLESWMFFSAYFIKVYYLKLQSLPIIKLCIQ